MWAGGPVFLALHPWWTKNSHGAKGGNHLDTEASGLATGLLPQLHALGPGP